MVTNGGMEHTKVLELLLADNRARQERLRAELEELVMAEHAMQVSATYEKQKIEMIRSQTDIRPLGAEDIQDKSQWAILCLIAERNNGWLVVESAIKLMVDAHVLSQDSASGQVYTLLRQHKPQLIQLTGGLYHLSVLEPFRVRSPGKANKRPAQSGLVGRVSSILKDHPDWKPKQLLPEVQRQGWDFGDKIPIFAVGMAYANLAKRRKKS